MNEETPLISQAGQEREHDDIPVRSAAGIALIALGLGVGFELLFYAHALGISVLIWGAIAALGLLTTARLAGIRPAHQGFWLAGPMLFFAAMISFRREPLTVLLDLALMLCLFAIWVRTFRRGRWLEFGWAEFSLALIWVPIQSWILPWRTLGLIQQALGRNRASGRRVMAIIRGILLALPVLVVFAALLSSADLVFGDYAESAFRWFDVERLADYSARSIVIVGTSLFFLGALLAAMQNPRKEGLIAQIEKGVGPFLGSIETVILLGLVNLLFTSFVIIQFAFLFGGEANIQAAGYTYAEYARRGFGELVAVSILSLGLILGLGTWSRRETRREIWSFRALSVWLVAGVGAILASALMRLLAYEAAYGFTRLRTYAHLGIFWMAVLFVAFLVLSLADQLPRFALFVAAAALGFSAMLNFLNVDAFIVRRNASRLALMGEIDIRYLTTLSEDAIPSLVALAGRAPEEVNQQLLPQLACDRGLLDQRSLEFSWQEFHFSTLAARKSLEGLKTELEHYLVKRQAGDSEEFPAGSLIVSRPGGEEYCGFAGDWGEGL